MPVQECSVSNLALSEISGLPRFGQISFVNCLPITLPIRTGMVSMDANVVFANPASLNSLFQHEKLDLGAMSSFFFLEQEKNFELIPTVSISSKGKVGSVLLFAKSKPSAESLLRIAADSSSASSVNLLKILLSETIGIKPQFVKMDKPDLFDPATDACLVIGDQALACEQMWSPFAHVVDLGQWWMETFGLPMVFGVWAARKDWLKNNRGSFEQIAAALQDASSMGLGKCFPQVLAEAKARTGLAESRLEKYFREELNFELGNLHLQGLALYRKLCYKHGLIS